MAVSVRRDRQAAAGLRPRRRRCREIVVLRLRNMTALDAHRPAGVRGPRRRRCTTRAATCCCAARASSRRSLMARADFHRHVGDENICPNIGDALARAETLHHERTAAADCRTSDRRHAHEPRRRRSCRHSRPSSSGRSRIPIRIRLLEVLVGSRRARACRSCSARSASISRSSRSSSRGCAPAASWSRGRTGSATRYAVTDPQLKNLLQVASKS